MRRSELTYLQNFAFKAGDDIKKAGLTKDLVVDITTKYKYFAICVT